MSPRNETKPRKENSQYDSTEDLTSKIGNTVDGVFEFYRNIELSQNRKYLLIKKKNGTIEQQIDISNGGIGVVSSSIYNLNIVPPHPKEKCGIYIRVKAVPADNTPNITIKEEDSLLYLNFIGIEDIRIGYAGGKKANTETNFLLDNGFNIRWEKIYNMDFIILEVWQLTI